MSKRSDWLERIDWWGCAAVGCIFVVIAAVGSSFYAYRTHKDDWIVIQEDASGQAHRCWMLPDTKLRREDTGSWWEAKNGNQIRVSNPYGLMTVEDDQWDSALAEFGLTRETCRTLGRSSY